MLGLRRPGAIGVKAVGPFDLGRLTRLHRSCFEDSWSRSDLAHLLALPGGFGLIARLQDGGLASLEALRGAGFSLCRVVRDESELLSIGVAPGFRRRGVATSLLRASMRRCHEWGAGVMFLEVAVDNVSAQRLYKVHGFEQVGRRPDYYQRANGERVSAYTMRCDLTQHLPAWIDDRDMA
ncbi:GNAT family N-acetyltransferase [Marinimicrococcus flavescens]|uniref:GNAT family N-acetyltransferase n=1 Tax=Marinimicrococcus flavescens TaxID=3031815 RepID=A0AAP3UYE0_9PROT|nr:GNAT family N-acetyltransferase [Marinimicrococcus flavescens]